MFLNKWIFKERKYFFVVAENSLFKDWPCWCRKIWNDFTVLYQRRRKCLTKECSNINTKFSYKFGTVTAVIIGSKYCKRFEFIDKILKSFTKVNSHDDCTICMEKLNGKISVKTQCNHIMHRKCLKTWLAESHTCPVCRSKLEEIKIDKNK